MARFAAIDMGSNGCRMLVVEATDPDSVRTLAYDRVPVRLGHGVFLTGRLEPDILDAAVRALRDFAERMEDLEVDRYRAVVTASAREADNGQELVRRAKGEAGIELEAIDGVEEARLVRLAVDRRLPLAGKHTLLVDLGGGSLELSESRGKREAGFSTSLEIGTVRLLETFLEGGARPVTNEQETLLNEYLERMMAPAWPALGRKPYDIVIGTGGNLEAIAQLCPTTRAMPGIDVRKATALLPRMTKLSAAERRAAYRLRQDRADVIVPALYVVLAVARAARVNEVTVPGVGLKDGIIAELVAKHFRVWDYRGEENAVADAALELGRKYRFDEAHAMQVARLAGDLFDALATIHNLESKDRLVLRVAALLHDIGDFVHFASHHKHTQYLIENSDLMGFSRDERSLLGCVARYHRRAMPSPKHEAFRKLDPNDRVRVRKLAALLRLADALDREHRRKVHRVHVQNTKRAVALYVRGEGDLSLETWTVERKAVLFESVFRRKLEVIVGNRPKLKASSEQPSSTKRKSKAGAKRTRKHPRGATKKKQSRRAKKRSKRR